MNFSELAFGLNIIRIISALGLIGLMISPFFFPAILYGLPRWPVPGKRMENKSGKINAGESLKASPHFEKVYLHSIEQSISSFMKKDQPYLQPHFNISQLAVEIDVPVHHLSYFFKEEKKQSFTDYRNNSRV